jgi:predicted RNA-binding Zn ribbon-like protein
VTVPFQLLASHPALDFVNTLDDRFAASGPRELMHSYADLLAFAGQSKLLSPREIAGLAERARTPNAAKVLRYACEMREWLATTVYSLLDGQPAPSSALSGLEDVFKEAEQHQELSLQRSASGNPPVWQPVWQWGRSDTRLELPLWALAKCANALLTSPEFGHVRACGSETCRWVFLDTSKNHSRRWCDMKICGNRMKARRFQARQ